MLSLPASVVADNRCSATPTAAPLRVYLFSLAYLALLFAAMVVDVRL